MTGQIAFRQLTPVFRLTPLGWRLNADLRGSFRAITVYEHGGYCVDLSGRPYGAIDDVAKDTSKPAKRRCLFCQDLCLAETARGQVFEIERRAPFRAAIVSDRSSRSLQLEFKSLPGAISERVLAFFRNLSQIKKNVFFA